MRAGIGIRMTDPCHSSLLCESHRKRLPARLDGRESQHGVTLLPSSGCLAEFEWPPQAKQYKQALWVPLLNASVGLREAHSDLVPAPGAMCCCCWVDSRWSQKWLSAAEQS